MLKNIKKIVKLKCMYTFFSSVKFNDYKIMPDNESLITKPIKIS